MSQTERGSDTRPTMDALLMDAAEREPRQTSLVIDDVRLTNAERAQRALRVAGLLQSYGLGPGDRIGIFMPNCADYLDVLFGAMYAGIMPVTINARYKSHDLAFVIVDSEIKCLFTVARVAENVDFLRTCLDGLPDLVSDDGSRVNTTHAPALERLVLVGGGSDRFAALEAELAGASDGRAANHSQDDIALMMYTSGTTANPKGCLLSHRCIVGNAIGMAERWRMSDADRFWDPLPFFHMSTILPLAACLVSDAVFFGCGHFDIDRALAVLRDDEITIAFPAFPTLMNQIIQHPEFSAAALPKLRVVNNVAPVDTLRRFQAAIPHVTQVSAYGLTEAGGVVSFGSPDDSLEQRVTSCGRPFPGIEVRTVDPETRQPTAKGETGDIQVRGYCLFDGYHNAPEATAQALQDGWLNTGDLGRVNSDGYISYSGRSKDMLKVGGENVAALEIESFLNSHPSVALSQVIGVDDDRYVEVPAAFVELTSGATLTGEALVEFCQGRIARFKIPRYIVFVREWPMSATKVQKYRLRDLPLGERIEV